MFFLTIRFILCQFCVLLNVARSSCAHGLRESLNLFLDFYFCFVETSVTHLCRSVWSWVTFLRSTNIKLIGKNCSMSDHLSYFDIDFDIHCAPAACLFFPCRSGWVEEDGFHSHLAQVVITGLWRDLAHGQSIWNKMAAGPSCRHACAHGVDNGDFSSSMMTTRRKGKRWRQRLLITIKVMPQVPVQQRAAEPKEDVSANINGQAIALPTPAQARLSWEPMGARRNHR